MAHLPIYPISRLVEITLPVAAAPAGALAAFVLGKILAIALLLPRFFLRARSRSRSAFAPGLGNVISSSLLNERQYRADVRHAGFRHFADFIL